MAQRPQTLYGIADSPIGLAAWFLDHDQKSYQMIARVFDGNDMSIATVAGPAPALARSRPYRTRRSRVSWATLAIDVFGTIKTRPPAERDACLATIAQALGLPSDGPWSLHLEWQDQSNALNELRPTQVDAVAISKSTVILFECKFTEAGGGCSQINPDKKGVIACNGRYELQTNPQNQVEGRCALSGKGIRYWDHIPAIYGLSAGDSHMPCLFAFDAYQWMRNVVLAHALKETTGKQTRVVVAYAKAGHLQTSAKVDDRLLGLTTLAMDDAVRPLSYDRILALAAAAAPSPVWADLSVWVQAKIERTAIVRDTRS